MTNIMLDESTISYADKLASQFYLRHGSEHLEREDLRSIARVALCEAAARYDSKRPVHFTTFAYLRVRGAMFDALRKERTNLQRGQNKQCDLSCVDRRPSNGSFYENRFDEEPMTSNNEYLETAGNEHLCANERSQEEICYLKQIVKALVKVLNCLPQHHKDILRHHYFSGCTFSEVARLMGGRAESWVSRHHQDALEILHAELTRVLRPSAIELRLAGGEVAGGYGC